MKEFVLYEDGRCALLESGIVIWSSDNDDGFQEEFGETIEPEDIDDALGYLVETDVLEDDEGIDIVDEGAPDTDTVETMTLPDDDLEGDFDDGDDPITEGETFH